MSCSLSIKNYFKHDFGSYFINIIRNHTEYLYLKKKKKHLKGA